MAVLSNPTRKAGVTTYRSQDQAHEVSLWSWSWDKRFVYIDGEKAGYVYTTEVSVERHGAVTRYRPEYRYHFHDFSSGRGQTYGEPTSLKETVQAMLDDWLLKSKDSHQLIEG